MTSSRSPPADKALTFIRMRLPVLITCLLSAMLCQSKCAEISPAPARTLFVSKLGDDSNGSVPGHTPSARSKVRSSALTDDHGGWRIVIRPDTYMEANLLPGLSRGSRRLQ